MMIFLENGCKLFDFYVATPGAMWTGFEPDVEGVFNETYVEILQVCSFILRNFVLDKSNNRKLLRVLATMESTLTWTCIKYISIPEYRYFH